MSGPDCKAPFIEKQCQILRLDALMQERDCPTAVLSLGVAVDLDSGDIPHLSRSPRSDVVDVIVDLPHVELI